MTVTSWLRSLFSRNTSKRPPRRTSSASTRPFRPWMEPLEDRTLLTAGALDPTFGLGGKVTTDFSLSADSGRSVAVQGDGKIVVAGLSGFDFAVARYNDDGSLDSTFGSHGRV